MKKLLLLSALALAVGAQAADKLEAGTADAPNYYVLKAGRGTPYLAFSNEDIVKSEGINVRLHRTEELTEANIWAVTPGEAEGTVLIKAYSSAENGLMTFINADGPFFGLGATATVSTPADIYPIYNADGTVSLALNTAAGKDESGYYTLDATGGSDFLGNWVPNSIGTNWTAFLLDMTDGADAALAAMQEREIKEASAAMVATYKGYFNAYIANVPWVADELNAGIEALDAMVPTADYADQITTIWNEACTNANNTIKTVFNGKVVALKNLRRAALGNAPYVGTNADNSKYSEVSSMDDANANFTMTTSGEEGGYIFYNAETKTYIGTSCTPVEDEASAQVLYPFLHAYGAYAGIALAQSSTKSGPGLNFQSWANGSVSYWSVNDEGSIWSIVENDDDTKMQEIVDINVAKLAPYVDALPEMVANILTTAIDQIKALTYSATAATEAEEIASTAIATANDLLAGGMNGIKLSLKNLRQNKFISIADGAWVYNEYNEAAETMFTFERQTDGGYILHNEAANIYVGLQEDQQNKVIPVAEAEKAAPVYPFLCKGGSFYGVALSLVANPTTSSTGLNTNANSHLFWTYSVSDAGSIFALVTKESDYNGDENSLAEITATGAVVEIVSGGINVRNVAEGESIAVYTLDGKIAKAAIVSGEETHLNLAAGVYIVKVSPATVAKILVK